MAGLHGDSKDVVWCWKWKLFMKHTKQVVIVVVYVGWLVHLAHQFWQKQHPTFTTDSVMY